MKITTASENSLILYFGESEGRVVSDDISQQIQIVKQLIELEFQTAIIELIPSYASLLVTFDPFLLDHFKIRHFVTQAVLPNANHSSDATLSEKVVELPVYYGEEVGLDLSRIAECAKLTVEQVIAKHQAQDYRVFAIGFAPGFGYLGQVDEQIATPRLATPRSAVPKGAVAIADQQTAIYPAQSPGGWNIIGRCPIDMFTPEQQQVMPFDVGDIVRFKKIDKQTFISMGGQL
ncbi:MAG: 5-oxoprolinase subunit PxpB [Gammaproteobacteria bacterium]|nr:5-oxoprolinase subunit PxpB [Gammaproteobacteria bacterium]